MVGVSTCSHQETATRASGDTTSNTGKGRWFMPLTMGLIRYIGV